MVSKFLAVNWILNIIRILIFNNKRVQNNIYHFLVVQEPHEDLQSYHYHVLVFAEVPTTVWENLKEEAKKVGVALDVKVPSEETQNSLKDAMTYLYQFITKPRSQYYGTKWKFKLI